MFLFVSATTFAYFYFLVEYLTKNMSYTRNVNIRGAPYDFRKAPSTIWNDYCGSFKVQMIVARR